MIYSDDDKALILLSQESSIKKKMTAYESVEYPRELFEDLSKADEIIDEMNKIGAYVVTVLNDNYPEKLKQIYDFPIALYCRGNIELLNDSTIIAVVGTRKPTRYGKDVTKEFAREITRGGATIVSGMARGIDSIAHQECLNNDGRTIAVVATGLDLVYPGENMELAAEIIRKGLMISEYPLATQPMAFRFPERNRIISALSDGVLIPEAGAKSGSLITANMAIEQGREVYVVPGSIYSSQSIGSNQMIKDVQATFVTCPQDILGAVGLSMAKKEELTRQMTIEQQMIINILSDEEVHFTDILEKSAMNVAELSALLTEMEIYGLIKRLSGNYYGLAPHS